MEPKSGEHLKESYLANDRGISDYESEYSKHESLVDARDIHKNPNSLIRESLMRIDVGLRLLSIFGCEEIQKGNSSIVSFPFLQHIE